MVDFKRAVVRELRGAGTGVLLDPEIGVGPASRTARWPAATGLIVAVEATGYEGPPAPASAACCPAGASRRSSAWGRPPPSCSSTTTRTRRTPADQERLVAEVAAACREADLALFLEPLSFGLDGGEAARARSADGWSSRRRPG